jgi:hypothetical protein
MNTMDFVTKVREMRQAQKDYFKNRLKSDLVKSKSLEREVDQALEEGVTVYATATLEELDGVPAEGEQLGMFDEPDAADPLDLSGE